MSRRTRSAAAILLPILLVLLPACRGEEPKPIEVHLDRVSVFNRTGEAWSHMDIWLNDHYRAQVPLVEPGGRVDVPLGVFIAGFGQRFDRKKQWPAGIEVTATDGKGQPVRIIWGNGRRR